MSEVKGQLFRREQRHIFGMKPSGAKNTKQGLERTSTEDSRVRFMLQNDGIVEHH